MINEEESHWKPFTRTKCVGFIVDLTTVQFCVSEETLLGMLSFIDKLFLLQLRCTGQSLLGNTVFTERALDWSSRFD